jgi:hypothetical protein
VGLTTSPPSVSRLCRKCGRLNVSQPYGSSRPVARTALPYVPIMLQANIGLRVPARDIRDYSVYSSICVSEVKIFLLLDVLRLLMSVGVTSNQ